MDIKDLNKQQLILLALLVSFVTSIATGIVTVTLMDQAPPGVTQTINRVVERTVQVVAPETGKTKEVITETVVIKEENLVAQSIEKYVNNVVRVGTIAGADAVSETSFKPTGESGFVISKDGFLVTDKELVRADRRYAIAAQNGAVREAKVLVHGDKLALLQIVPESAATGTAGVATGTPKAAMPHFADVAFADPGSVRIGQTAVSLGYDSSVSLLLGVISKIDRTEVPAEKAGEAPRSEVSLFRTNVDLSGPYSGGPLFSIRSELIGVNVVSAAGDEFSVPSSAIGALMTTYRTKGITLEKASEAAPEGARNADQVGGVGTVLD